MFPFVEGCWHFWAFHPKHLENKMSVSIIRMGNQMRMHNTCTDVTFMESVGVHINAVNW